MIRVALVILLALFQCVHTQAQTTASDKPLRVLMTVGGVGYNTLIVRMLKGQSDLAVTVRDVDENNIVFTADALANVDAVLMYHRDNVAEPEERSALMNFVENGGGVVVLHHAIANYPDWETWWREHVGGLYVLAGHEGLAPSRYFYDFRGVARPVSEHPITERIGAFWRYADESYERLWVANEVTDLLRTTAFGSDERVAWIGPSPSNRVVFIQPGHGDPVMTDPKYLMLIEDALRWTARE